jgi:hypothetical protein
MLGTVSIVKPDGILSNMSIENFMSLATWDNKSEFYSYYTQATYPSHIGIISKEMRQKTDFLHLLQNGGDSYSPLPPTYRLQNLKFIDASGCYYPTEAGFAPIKVGLKNQSVIVDSENKFKFDVDGFDQNMFPAFKTTGGLEKDEAWLMLDRGKAGFYNETGALDGDDIFGDHLGKFPSGYEDLQAAFKGNLHLDDKQGIYLELKQLNWFEKLWIQLYRFVTGLFGAKHSVDINYDLKLLDKDHQVLFASDKVSKIYTSYKNVLEFDKSGENSIRQRAKVVFIDGTEATSGDTWFSIAE